jgi:hypothetical protein
LDEIPNEKKHGIRESVWKHLLEALLQILSLQELEVNRVYDFELTSSHRSHRIRKKARFDLEKIGNWRKIPKKLVLQGLHPVEKFARAADSILCYEPAK